jgi:glycosyltransferase involved in cell wall biosynthesis
VVGEDPTVERPPLERPGRRAVDQSEPAHEDLVDASRQRRRESVGGRRDEIRVARDDRTLTGEAEHAVELRAIAVDVEVDDLKAVEVDCVGDPPQLRLADDCRAEVVRGARRQDRASLPGHRRAEQPVVQRRDGPRADGEQRPARDGRGRMHSAPVLEVPERPDRQLLQADDVGVVAGHELEHLAEKRPALRRGSIPVEKVPSPHEHGHGVAYGAVRVLLADPPAFTPPYDHELAAALARAGVDVELATSHFRFGEAAVPDGYRRKELFYPLSSRLFRRSRLRLPVKALEHPFGMGRLARQPADVVHFQWLAVPQVDELLLRLRAPAVFTAHDLLPRRTASKLELWRRLLARFAGVVVHSERGRTTLAELGVEPARVHVIPHPVFPSDPPRGDDGRTLLCLGVIRPYKGLDDAIEATLALDDARLLVAGDPAERLDAYRARAGDRGEWRLGYLPDAELDRALGDATVALFPYRAELDQSGALLRALGAGVPAVVYDVGGLAEPVERFGAGRVVPAGDVDALTRAAGELLGDREALEAARAGARAAREALTWDASAEAHLALYRSLG